MAGLISMFVMRVINERMRQENALFINNHDLTFTEKAKEYGLAE